MGEAGSAVEMGRLEAPARYKPRIVQHQRRALRRSVAGSGSSAKKRSAIRPLRSWQGAVAAAPAVSGGGIKAVPANRSITRQDF